MLANLLVLTNRHMEPAREDAEDAPVAEARNYGVSPSGELAARVGRGADVFAVIASLQELRRLDLRLTRVEDVSPLSTLQNLSYLYLSSTRVEDVSPLSSLQNLSYLDLSSTRVEDVSPLDAIEGLTISS